MKKILTSGLVATLVIPGLAFAAYNDVSLTTDAVFSVNSITMNVSGSTATIESVVAGATTLVVTLQANSSFEVTAPNLNQLATNQPLGVSADVCNGTLSKLGYTASSSQIVVTVTPSATLCTGPSANTSGGVGSGGGGGGGATATQASPVAKLVAGTDFSSLTPAAKQAVIAQIRAALIPLIQKLLALLNQQLQALQASGGQ